MYDFMIILLSYRYVLEGLAGQRKTAPAAVRFAVIPWAANAMMSVLFRIEGSVGWRMVVDSPVIARILLFTGDV